MSCFVQVPGTSPQITLDVDQVVWCEATNNGVKVRYAGVDGPKEITTATPGLALAAIEWARQNKKQVSTMGMSDIFTDLRGYIKENRELIYTIALVVVLDQWLFEGAFRERLKGIVEGFLRKAESRAGGQTIDVTPVK